MQSRLSHWRMRKQNTWCLTAIRGCCSDLVWLPTLDIHNLEKGLAKNRCGGTICMSTVSRPNLPPEGLGMGFAPTGLFFRFGGYSAQMRGDRTWRVWFVPIAFASRWMKAVAVATLLVNTLVAVACSEPPRARLETNGSSETPIESKVGDHLQQPQSLAGEEQPRDSRSIPTASLHEPAPNDQSPPLDASGRRVELPGGLVAFPDAQRVEVAAITCLEAGWLEQVACAPGTREHESLVVIEARPSDVHAAMLLAGFQPGAPGRWTYENQKFAVVPPRGDAVRITVRWQRGEQVIEEPIGAWMQDPEHNKSFPDTSWIFGGSLMAANPPAMGPGEHYVADYSGSIIGLVTFGDEVIGFSEVVADEVEVQEPLWQVNSRHVPPFGTKVTVILTGASPGEEARPHANGR